MREVGCGTVFLRRALGVCVTAPRFLPQRPQRAKSLRHKKTASRYAWQRLSPRCGMLLHAVKLPGREEQHAVTTGYGFKLRQLFAVHRSSDKRKKELLHYAA